MAKEGAADGAPTEEAGPSRYEERDLNMLESTRNLPPAKNKRFKEYGLGNGFPIEDPNQWFKPVNAYRIYASKSANLDDVIDMIAFEMASGISSVVEDKGTTSPAFRAAVDNITKNEIRIHLNKEKGEAISKRRGGSRQKRNTSRSRTSICS